MRAPHLVPFAAVLCVSSPSAAAPQQQFKEVEAIPSLPPGGRYTDALALGDVDGDGAPDVVVASGGIFGGNANLLYLNDGTGLFANAPAGHLPRDQDYTNAVALGDVDGDGDLDIVFGNGGGYLGGLQNRLLLNDGSGVFQDVTATHMPVDRDVCAAVVVGDVDGDGDADLVLAASPVNKLYLNDGSGAFADATAGRLPPTRGDTLSLVLGDVDGDGDPDLVLGNSGLGAAAQNQLFLNDGLGTFTDATGARLPVDTATTAALALGDVDGDGDPDLVLGNTRPFTGGQDRLYLNEGTGFFHDVTAAAMPPDADDTTAVALGDVDGDGDLDLALAGGARQFADQQNRLYINDGLGRFADATAARLPARLDRSSSVHLVDVDRDDDLDYVVGNFSTLLPGGVTAPARDWAYLNLHRQLSRPARPALSRTYPLELFAKPGYALSSHTALPFLSASLAPSPVAIVAWGELFLAPPLVGLPSATIPQATGMAIVPLSIPGNPALVGVVLYSQALIFSNGSPLDVHLTGYLADAIGP